MYSGWAIHQSTIIPTPADVIAMDVTYFGRLWGILTAINAHNGKPLYCEATNGYETVWDYEKAIRKLHKYNVYPKIAITDGKSGVIKMLEEYGICLITNLPYLFTNQEYPELEMFEFVIEQ